MGFIDVFVGVLLINAKNVICDAKNSQDFYVNAKNSQDFYAGDVILLVNRIIILFTRSITSPA